MSVAKMTTKAQITVPKALRECLGLVPGDEIEFVEEDGQWVVRRHEVASRFQKYRGCLSHLGGQDPDALVDEMRGTP
jgi:antitoxin PrlF